jgi:hypothetical protein
MPESTVHLTMSEHASLVQRLVDRVFDVMPTIVGLG